MTALFCRPLDFTVVSASAVVTAPASNTNLDEAGMVWRSTNGGNIIIDMGAGASYDTIAVLGSNLRATDTIQVRTGTSNTGTGGAYTGGAVAAFTGNKPGWMTTKSIVRLGSTITDRYIRIDITASGHPAGYSQVQRILVGKCLTTLGIDYDCEQIIFDPSLIETNRGTDTIDYVAPRMRWKFTMGWVNADSWKSEWMNFAGYVGRTKPILFVPYVENPADWQSEAIFGRIRSDIGARSISYAKRALDLTIESLAP